MSTKMKSIAAAVRAFLHAKRGNVAMMFAIAMVPIVIGAGVGLDFARAMLARQQMSEALDAAALAVGSTTGLDATKAQALAQKYFDANYTLDQTTSGFGTPTLGTPTYDANGSIILTASVNVPTILMKFINITQVPVTTTSTVVWGQTKLWVALVLDNSGSMCRPDAQPCLNNSNTASKIYQLKDATKTMLTSLQGVSTTAGDVQVAIVPFNREVDVGTGNVGASWIYWGFWEEVPKASGTTTIVDTYGVPNLNKSSSSSPNTIAFSAWGPGDDCPFTSYSNSNDKNTVLSPFGFYCMPTNVNNAVSFNSEDNITNSSGPTVRQIPSSGTYNGQICPSMDSGDYNTERNAHYYNGCWTSTKVNGSTITVDQGSSSASCKGFTATNCSCSGSNGSRICKTQKWTHTWVPNNHSTWGGCITDRVQNYDIGNASPVGSNTTGFPADNPASPVSATDCMYGNVTPLEYNWTDLTSKVNAMQAKGSTNQAVGVAHGWQALTTGNPYGAPTVPANTTRYIILLSDGLNTQNRWWGDGSTEGTSDDDKIDDRMNQVCSAAKADKVVIYTIYVHASSGEAATSAPLQDCASDASKYYNLSSSAQIAVAFADITKQITNVRVSK